MFVLSRAISLFRAAKRCNHVLAQLLQVFDVLVFALDGFVEGLDVVGFGFEDGDGLGLDGGGGDGDFEIS